MRAYIDGERATLTPVPCAWLQHHGAAQELWHTAAPTITLGARMRPRSEAAMRPEGHDGRTIGAALQVATATLWTASLNATHAAALASQAPCARAPAQPSRDAANSSAVLSAAAVLAGVPAPAHVWLVSRLLRQQQLVLPPAHRDDGRAAIGGEAPAAVVRPGGVLVACGGAGPVPAPDACCDDDAAAGGRPWQRAAAVARALGELDGDGVSVQTVLGLSLGLAGAAFLAFFLAIYVSAHEVNRLDIEGARAQNAGMGSTALCVPAKAVLLSARVRVQLQLWRMHKNLKAMQDMLGSILAAGRPAQSAKPSGSEPPSAHATYGAPRHPRPPSASSPSRATSRERSCGNCAVHLICPVSAWLGAVPATHVTA